MPRRNKYENEKWRQVITSSHNFLSLNLRELYNNRDLLFIFTRRDILSVYKQTILGPLWFFIQPALTTIVYVIIFSRAAKLSTSEIPPPLFYLSGLVLWSYYADCIMKTSTFFKDNTQILTKVYFPRLLIPLSLIITNFAKFCIQFLLFIIVYIYFLAKGTSIHINSFVFLFPVLVAITALLGLGAGMIVSSLSIRY